MARDGAKFAIADRALWAAKGLEPDQLQLRLDRTDAVVRAQAIGSGPTVLFIHGGSNAGSSWIDLVSRLPDYRCVMVDRPGCGLSAPLRRSVSEVAAFEAYADGFVADVFDALGEPSSAVVATSYGGYFGLRGAAAYPDRVTRLVTLGYSIGAAPVYLPLVMRIGSMPRISALTNRLPMPKVAVRGMVKQIGLRDAVKTGAFTDDMVTWFHALLTSTDTMRNEVAGCPRVITLGGANPAMFLTDAVLSKITAPTLALWGRDDPMGGENVAAPFIGMIPGAALEMVRGGHAVWIDDADGIAKRVSDFLGG
ncbi:MAG: alpha/beta hydrolase [Acidimicrobiales bacterium]|nr:alpha/beta hydrolase [Acidimicrobiales bacterium]